MVDGQSNSLIDVELGRNTERIHPMNPTMVINSKSDPWTSIWAGTRPDIYCCLRRRKLQQGMWKKRQIKTKKKQKKTDDKKERGRAEKQKGMQAAHKRATSGTAKCDPHKSKTVWP